MNPTVPSEQPASTPTREQGRVLLVTDAPAIADYGSALERAGFAVVGVSGGTAAIVSLRRSRPEVVVADIRLTGITAQELLRAIGQAHESLPVILVGTDRSDAERRTSAVQAGAYDYLELPAELDLLLARVGQLVALSKMMDRLRAEADRDYLTGLANRRRFRAALGKELERWRRYRVPCALLLVDVDYMKKINDTYGHSAGDVVIRHIASSLIEHSRDNDTAARLGGEEFALLLAGTDDAKATLAAERLRHSIAGQRVEPVGTVTVSLGIAACPVHANTERTLYAASDAALYRAKREGRDRTIIAHAPGTTEAARV